MNCKQGLERYTSFNYYVCAPTEQGSVFRLSCRIAGELNCRRGIHSRYKMYVAQGLLILPSPFCHMLNLQAKSQSIVTSPKIKMIFFLLLGVLFQYFH